MRQARQSGVHYWLTRRCEPLGRRDLADRSRQSWQGVGGEVLSQTRPMGQWTGIFTDQFGWLTGSQLVERDFR